MSPELIRSKKMTKSKFLQSLAKKEEKLKNHKLSRLNPQPKKIKNDRLLMFCIQESSWCISIITKVLSHIGLQADKNNNKNMLINIACI